MSNKTQAFNFLKSARIIDPQTFPANAPYVARFQPHESEPALGYICANILPTSEGYQAFFGTRQQLGSDLLPEETYDVMTYVSPTGDIFAIALTSQSIRSQGTEFASPIPLVTADDAAEFETATFGMD